MLVIGNSALLSANDWSHDIAQSVCPTQECWSLPRVLVPPVRGPQECVENNPGGTPAPEHRAFVLPKSVGPASIATARGPQKCVENNRGDTPSSVHNGSDIVEINREGTPAPDKSRSDSVREGSAAVVYNVENNLGPAPD